MQSIIIFSACLSLCVATGVTGPYSFGYQTADGQSRQESGHGGAVTGSYSYVDANGDHRQVRYVADANGYRAEGDVSVDKRTALAAAALNALAPKAPVAVAPVGYAPAPLPYAAAPFAAYSSWGAPAAYASYAPYGPVSIPGAVIAPRGYSVHTPTHSINFQI